jgi:hypothetical protein
MKLNIFSKKKNPSIVQVDRVKELEAKVEELTYVTDSSYMLKMLDANLGSEKTENIYKTHYAQTHKLIWMYKGWSDWGNDLAKRLVNLCADLQVGNGLELEGTDGAEKVYIDEFIRINGLNSGTAIQLAREAQLNGQVLVQLVFNKDDGQVYINYIPWSQFQYTVKPIGKSNLNAPYQAKWTDENGKEHTLKNDELAFIAFNSIVEGETIEGHPSLGNVICRIENIGKEMYNWKLSNHLYSHPTPYFETTDQTQADKIRNTIKNTGWKCGTAFAGAGKLNMVVPQNYYQTILENITTNVKIVAAASGISVNWIGWGGEMNRASAQTTGESWEIANKADLACWTSFYTTLFENVIKIRNANLDSPMRLDPKKIKPIIGSTTDRQLQMLKDFWLPAAQNNLVSQELFTKTSAAILGFEADEELTNVEKQQEENKTEATDINNGTRSNPSTLASNTNNNPLREGGASENE